ncbi:unnamed protein product [Cylindrotheca closterium]|uniref:Palmitoyltransferase n=1 Tax=Cylindrotheca closterium TaxID=2856 RepID=A0AAD2G3J5_9STRA|nr:unnamed protein product [Cylindrotheca closterium]
MHALIHLSTISSQNAPVHLESYGNGGYGPATGGAMMMDDEYKKSLGGQPSVYFSGMPDCCSNRRVLQDEGPGAKYYRDNFNDMSWSCSLGTGDEHGIWMNRSDPAGTIMAMMVWVLMAYSMVTITLLAQTGGIPVYLSYSYSILCCMALACHAKTSITDPGSVPPSAVPTEAQRRADKLAMCSQCQTFKPPLSHHCRICNRCISKMDHHCPWMNNCVGAGNMKHFFLFLIYTWSCSVYSLTLLGFNYFFCAAEDCVFNVVLIQLVRIMTMLSIGAFLFTSSMVMNVVYGLMTGIGTIDRLKKKATNTMSDALEEPVPLTSVFGIGPLYTWLFPTDPVFDDYDEIMGYSTPQRLLREQILKDPKSGGSGNMNGNGVPNMIQQQV